MTQNELTAISPAPGTFYDRIASLYNLTFKFNGYGRSLENYLRENPLPLAPDAKILDAGCGTGLLTLALLKALVIPVRITAIDLSASSLTTAKRAVTERREHNQEVALAQANVLALPFADDSFDFVMTSGVLEYVPLQDGFRELARVLVSGGFMLHLPVKPSPASRFLELLFRFKAHTPREVSENTKRHFRVVKHYEFPPQHIIGWTKTIVLAQKV